ncbi:MAG TPA: hypothetical protein VGI71_09730 [Scandinavium sp.]|jgi:hypothetical protein
MRILTLDDMITPKILTSLYIFTTLVAFVALVFTLSVGHYTGSIILAVVIVFNRVFFECIIVVFKNNEHLKNSAEYLRYIANTMANNYDEEHIAAARKAKESQQFENDADFSTDSKEDTPQDKQ